jgi:transcription elongation GreA/GreB family factor
MSELKKLVITEAIRVTRSMLATAEESRKNAIEESRYHKGAMESRYDTFKEEAQYLMSAQDVRIMELNSTIAVLESLLVRPHISSAKAKIFSLVELEDEEGNFALYLILPAGGGIACTVQEQKVTTINESSPLACALIGKAEGEDVELDIAGNSRVFSIISIS